MTKARSNYATITRHLRNIALGYYILAILGCTAPPAKPEPPTLSSARELETRLTLRSAPSSPQRAASDLQQALHLYSLVDDQEGQVRCHIKLARLYLGLGQTEDASRHVQRAEAIATGLGAPEYLYQSHLLDARLSGDPVAYERALAQATSPIEKAVALAYLSRIDEAYKLIKPELENADAHPDDYAFVLYEYAKQYRDASTAQTALALFKKADYHQAIANTLYLLAVIYRDTGQRALARLYYQRALTVSLSLGDQAKARTIESQLNQL